MFKVIKASIFESIQVKIHMQAGYNDATPITVNEPTYELVAALIRPSPPGNGNIEILAGVAVSYEVIAATSTGMYVVTIDQTVWTVPGIYTLVAVVRDPLDPYYTPIPAQGISFPITIMVTADPPATFFRVGGADSASSILISPYVSDAGSNHWKDSFLRMVVGNTAGQQKKITGSTRLVSAFTGATYDHVDDGHGNGDQMLLTTHAFENYVHEDNTYYIYLYNGPGGTGSITDGFYLIASRISDAAVLLDTAPAGADSAGNVRSGGIVRVSLVSAFTEAPILGDMGSIIAE